MSTTKRPKPKGAPGDINLSPGIQSPAEKEIGRGMSWDGLPYRGPVMNFKENDPENMLPQMDFEAHVKIFELNNKEHLEEYEKILRKMTKGEATQFYELKEYDKDIKSWRVLIAYTDVFFRAPTEDEQQQR